MNKQELKSEQKRLKGKIQQLESIADRHKPAVLELEFLKEELKWVEIQLDRLVLEDEEKEAIRKSYSYEN